MEPLAMQKRGISVALLLCLCLWAGAAEGSIPNGSPDEWGLLEQQAHLLSGVLPAKGQKKGPAGAKGTGKATASQHVPFSWDFPVVDAKFTEPEEMVNRAKYVEQLTKYGWREEDVRDALKLQHWDLNNAADYLSSLSRVDRKVRPCIGKDNCFGDVDAPSAAGAPGAAQTAGAMAAQVNKVLGNPAGAAMQAARQRPNPMAAQIAAAKRRLSFALVEERAQARATLAAAMRSHQQLRARAALRERAELQALLEELKALTPQCGVAPASPSPAAQQQKQQSQPALLQLDAAARRTGFVKSLINKAKSVMSKLKGGVQKAAPAQAQAKKEPTMQSVDVKPPPLPKPQVLTPVVYPNPPGIAKPTPKPEATQSPGAPNAEAQEKQREEDPNLPASGKPPPLTPEQVKSNDPFIVEMKRRIACLQKDWHKGPPGWLRARIRWQHKMERQRKAPVFPDDVQLPQEAWPPAVPVRSFGTGVNRKDKWLTPVDTTDTPLWKVPANFDHVEVVKQGPPPADQTGQEAPNPATTDTTPTDTAAFN